MSNQIVKYDPSQSVRAMTAVTKDGKTVRGLPALSVMLTERKGAIGSVAPSFMSPDHIIKVAVNNFTDPKKAKLFECTGDSIFRAIMQAAELGLDPGGVLGLAHLVPYGKECQMLVDYKGLCELCYRSQLVKSINTFPVYATDQYELVMGRNPGVFNHRPDLQSPRRYEDVLFLYTYIELTNGGVIFDYMTRPEVEAVRLRSRASGNGPWVTDTVEMAKKTCLRRALKRAPKSIEMRKALALDSAQDSGEPAPVMLDTTFDVIDAEVAPVAPAVSTRSVRAKLEPAAPTEPFPTVDAEEIEDPFEAQ